jgi:hypothetical protein
VSGCSIESMSFVYGGFHDSCLEYEVLTATGEVLTCRRDNEHRLVFEMMHNSFGCGSFMSWLDGSKNDHLTSFSCGRRGGSGFGTILSA